jgi:hypothetical protein
MTNSFQTVLPAAAFAAACLLSAGPLSAATDVRVVIRGVVESNSFRTGTWASVRANDPVRVQIDLDSTNYLDSPNLPGRTRGYRFSPSTFTMSVGSIVAPLRSNVTSAYFCLRNNDPAVDGFFISQGTDIDVQIPLQMTPDGYGIAFARTFDISPVLSSLNILGACRSYAFENMSSYNFNIELNESVTPLIFVYQSISISQCVSIVSQPSNTSVCRGDGARFSIVANGTSPTFQWQIESPAAPGTWIPLTTASTPLSCGGGARISAGFGASSQIFVQPCANTTNYRIRCVTSNDCGSVASSAATLTLNTCPPPCPADFNQDGGIDGADIEAFFLAWESGGAAADVNFDGGVDGSDLEAFFRVWEAGSC